MSETEFFSYSESFKIKMVKEHEELGVRQADIRRMYGVPGSTLRDWLRKYGKRDRSVLVMRRNYVGHIIMKDEREKQIKELEEKLSDALAKIGVYESLCELAKEEYQIDLKKSYYTQALELVKAKGNR